MILHLTIIVQFWIFDKNTLMTPYIDRCCGVSSATTTLFSESSAKVLALVLVGNDDSKSDKSAVKTIVLVSRLCPVTSVNDTTRLPASISVRVMRTAVGVVVDAVGR